MDEELEKKIGKIVLSISNGFLKVLNIYMIFPFICTLLGSHFPCSTGLSWNREGYRYRY
jgi:hypothetical protein